MPTPTIYYIRHGETAWNAEGRLQGALDVPLNDLGRRQAAQVSSPATVATRRHWPSSQARSAARARPWT
jgi:broad specificity phosphatase PhoE